MAEKMRTHEAPYRRVPSSDLFLSEAARDYFFASGCVLALAMLAYSLVNIALTNTRDPSQPDVESVVGYILIILGYLLLPGVGVLLVRRKRCLARNRVLLMAETDVGDGQFMDTFGGNGLLSGNIFGTRQLIRDIEQASKCVTWGAADDQETQCSVCLNNLEEGSEARVLPCNHVFHKGCADLWLVSGRKNSCPLCMRRVCSNRGADMAPNTR